MRALRLSTVLLMVAVVTAVPVAAEPTFLLHVTETDFSGCDVLDVRSMECDEDEFDVAPTALDDYFAWVIVSDVAELTAAEFGVSYESTVNVAAWVGCTAVQVPYNGWPASETGIVVAMGECHQTAGNQMAKLGFFFVTSQSSGPLGLIPSPQAPATSGLGVIDCTHSYVNACEHNGRLVFDGAGGYLPTDCRCSGPPAVPASWSAIKTRFRDP